MVVTVFMLLFGINFNLYIKDARHDRFYSFICYFAVCVLLVRFIVVVT